MKVNSHLQSSGRSIEFLSYFNQGFSAVHSISKVKLKISVVRDKNLQDQECRVIPKKLRLVSLDPIKKKKKILQLNTSNSGKVTQKNVSYLS